MQRLPKPVEIALFALMAVVCAMVVTLSPRQDSALFFAGAPLFLVCALMGYRRTERLRLAEDEASAADELAP